MREVELDLQVSLRHGRLARLNCSDRQSQTPVYDILPPLMKAPVTEREAWSVRQSSFFPGTIK